VVRGENQRKNRVLDDIGKAEIGDEYDHNDLMETHVDGWYFTGTGANRVLHVVTKGKSQAKKNALQGAANSKHGVGKVTIE